jgi:hypothetical protein
MRVLIPFSANAWAKWKLKVDLPTPPLLLKTEIIFI